QWYRYHSLFADILRHRLHQQDPMAERAYRRRAQVWLEQAGYEHEAITQALAGQDWEEAARLIARCADAAWRSGEMGSLAAWLGALPPRLVHEQPRLGLFQALLLMLDHKYTAAKEWLCEVEENLDQEEESESVLALCGRAATIHSLVDQALY